MLDTDIREMLKTEGFLVGVNLVDDNPNALRINSNNLDTVENAADFIANLMEGDLVRLDTVTADNGLRQGYIGLESSCRIDP